MPDLDLPVPGVTKGPAWAQKLIAAIAEVNTAADETAEDVNTRLSEEALESTIGAQASAFVFDAKVATGSARTNDINEWWVDPVAYSEVDNGGPFTFKAAVGAPDETVPPYVGSIETFTAAPIYLSEWRPGYPVRQVLAGWVNADDHNVPACLAITGRRRVAVWSQHYADQLTTFVLSDRSGSLESMALGAGNATTVARTGLTAYAQVFLDPGRSTSTLSYYWLFQRVRRGSSGDYKHGWTITEFTVNETVDVGGLTLISESASAGHGQRFFIRAEDGLWYLTGHQDGGTLRFLWGPHPSGNGKLTTIEVDMATGAITGSGLSSKNIFFTPADANSGAVYDADLTFDRPALPAGQRRRHFYRERDGYLRAQWTTGDEDNATYLYAERVNDGFGGLRTTATPGYAQGTFRVEQNQDGGFNVEWQGYLPTSLTGGVDIVRRFNSSTDGAWYLRVTATGQMSFGFLDTAGNLWTYSSAVLSGLVAAAAAGTKIGLKFQYSPNESGETKVRPQHSVDGAVATYTAATVATRAISGTWLGTLGWNGSTPGTTSPFRVGQGTQARTILTTLVRMSDLADTTVVVNTNMLAGWPPHAATYTDVAGQAWTLVGDAIVGSAADVYVDHEMGIAGRRIGHGVDANYIAGGCIVTNTDGSTRAVVTVHRSADQTESYVLVWKRAASGTWISNEVYRTPDVLARPYATRGKKGPVGVFLSVIREYGQGENEFDYYFSDTYALAAI